MTALVPGRRGARLLAAGLALLALSRPGRGQVVEGVARDAVAPPVAADPAGTASNPGASLQIALGPALPSPSLQYVRPVLRNSAVYASGGTAALVRTPPAGASVAILRPSAAGGIAAGPTGATRAASIAAPSAAPEGGHRPAVAARLAVAPPRLPADGSAAPERNPPSALRDAGRVQDAALAGISRNIPSEDGAALAEKDFDGAGIARSALESLRPSVGAAESARPAARGVRPDSGPRLSYPSLRRAAAQARGPESGLATGGTDDLGGPRSAHPPLARQAAKLLSDVPYGVKWGIYSLGMLAAANLASTVLHAAIALFWGAAAGPHVVGGMDPTLREQFGQVLAQRPWAFLFYEVPWQMLREEAEFRFAIFGGLFLGLAGLKPALGALGRLVAGCAAGSSAVARARTAAGRAIARLGGVSRFSFPIAAVAAGLYFAARHFALWGADPVGIVVRTGFAVSMAWVFYKTRSLVAPITAHWLYDALQFFGAILVFHFGLAPILSDAYMMFINVASLAFLWYGVAAWLKARAAARAGASLQ